MDKQNRPPDPMGGSFRWAWRRGREHLVGFVLGGVMLGVVGIAFANIVTAPPDANLLERIAYSAVGFLAALAVTALAAYGWALVNAPYEQRDKLRQMAVRISDSESAQEDRRKRLQESRALQGETFHVWELLKPNQRPLVEHRVFADCVIRGPAIVGFAVTVDIVNSTVGNAPIESHLFLAIPNLPRHGIIGFVSCKFQRCKFEDIGFYGDQPLLDKLAQSQVV